ncbi:hypothetical protein [Nitrosopumilus piranensis]|uniref:DUF998 domain-containing protein n=1 Tax=Nitrosopumilus piranensis TaxID=1582439 RepID=A0A0C5BTX7_9ARCH|nr:hypothetical protein [Nitrosopumilus piranensis]AJM91736.1 conserved membrane protein of unknown function [Nitrosopumilus piranensis]
MRLIQRISNYTLTKSDNLVRIICILSVIGPVITVSAGFWDAISHLQKEPEFFWSPSHMIVYTGVSMITAAAILGGILIIRKSIDSSLKTGIKLVMVGSVIQIISGFGDSLSHEIFGIDGLVSWSHQPLELGLVLGSLGGLLILKNKEHTKLKILLPFSIVTFLFFTIWLGFNLVLIFGHIIQCIPVYEIFSSGCAIL